jgi:small-conductance mechanosensitive channel
MTEYELGELIVSYSGLVATYLTTYLTVVSGYLITAYVAGKRFSTSQVILLNCLFVVATAMLTMAVFASSLRWLSYLEKLEQLVPNEIYPMSLPLAIAICFLCIAGILASIKFMWDVRHPKPD